MKYISRIVFILSLAFGLVACNEVVVIPEAPVAGEVPFELTFSTAEKTVQTKSKVKGAENRVHTMQLVCFDANGLYLGMRDATVTSTGPGTNPPMFDTGKISGTVPQNTARIHFIANRKLDNPLSHSSLTPEATVMNSVELSTIWNDTKHQEICFWGFHKEDSAEAMNEWLKPAEGANHIVYLIRDRARVILSYDPTGSTVPVTKIEWLIHNGRERGYLAPAATSWTNTGYYANSQKEGHTNELVSVAGMHEYTTCDRYSLWRSQADNDSTAFDVAYQNSANTNIPQYLFDDDNAAIDDLKVILRVTYTVSGSPKTVYHVLRLNDDDGVLYDVVRNNTYYINCKLLSPDVAYYDSLKDAIDGEEFVNADVEIDRSIPDINDNQYTLQIKLPTETTSIVFNTEGQHKMDFVFRMVSDVNVTGSTDPSDFEVTWEKSQTFCENSLPVTYNSTTKQFTITATVKTGQLTDQLQDEWIVVKHKTSGLTRYIHVYVIDQFRYKINPTLTKVGNDYRLSFTLPPVEHSQFLPDGSPDPTELIYPESLYPIDIKFTTNTLNAYGITQGTENYGLFGVSVEETSSLTNASNFEPGYNSPVSSTNYNADRTHWYFQQADNYWDFLYTYNLKSYPEGGQVNIFFKDVRDHIKYATVSDVGLFLYVEYFGKNYSVHP